MVSKGTKQKIALVTGASSGIGAAISRQLLEDGLIVVAGARNIDSLRDLEQPGAHPVVLDVTSESDMCRVVDELHRTFGGIDVLVNNAGFGLYGAIEDLSLDEARYQFEVNLFGVARLTQLVLPGMRAAGSGTIICISSMAGRMYTPLGGWYHASKHALEGWSDCLRLEVAQFGIDVVIVEPGIIDTGFGDVLVDPLLRASGSGPYGDLAMRVGRVMHESYAAGRGSRAEVVAGVVSRAVAARRPRTRYVVGQYARPLMWMRKYMGDRLYDRIVMMAMR